MKTAFLLMAQYDGLAVIPVAGEIDLPIVRMESSQKSAKGVHVHDLAAYLDKQVEAARKECEQLRRSA
jgi:Pyocin activator protein PrtN